MRHVLARNNRILVCLGLWVRYQDSDQTSDERGLKMDQKFEGTPTAEISLDGRQLTRSHVSNDWGLRLQWQIKRDGKVVASPLARADMSYEHADKTPGKYEVVLQMWKYINYKKNKKGEFTESKFIDISNAVSYTISSDA
jgi:hypothetical protein